MPLDAGSTTPTAKAAATAASITLPPPRNISRAAALASRCLVDTMPRSPSASCLLLENTLWLTVSLRGAGDGCQRRFELAGG